MNQGRLGLGISILVLVQMLMNYDDSGLITSCVAASSLT
jgi:hypothetical protein